MYYFLKTRSKPIANRASISCTATLLMAIIFLSGISGWAVSPADIPDKGDSLVGEIIKAYGGETALRRIKATSARGAIKAVLLGDVGISTRFFQRPRKLRVELAYHNSSENRILNGFKGWRSIDDGAMREVKGPPYLAMAYQYKYLDFPLGLLDGGFKIFYAGNATYRGTHVDILRLVDNEGPTIHLFVDSRTKLIIRVSGAFNFGTATTDLSAEFSDYRKIEGVLFPFRITNYGGDQLIAETLITEFKINPQLPDALFLPEQGKQKGDNP